MYDEVFYRGIERINSISVRELLGLHLISVIYLSEMMMDTDDGSAHQSG